MGWYEGQLVLDEKGDPLDPKAEVAVVYSALRQVGVALGKTGQKAKDQVA